MADSSRVARGKVEAIACLLGALSVAPGALARTYYVSPQGSDAGRGTSSRHPWRTVYRVEEAHLRPGNEVLFRGGELEGDR